MLKGRRGPLKNDEAFTTTSKARKRTSPSITIMGMLVKLIREDNQKGLCCECNKGDVRVKGRAHRAKYKARAGFRTLICWLG